MERKLTYFNLPAFGEAIRYMLHYSGLKFEDVRIEVKDWPNESLKSKLPYGQMPLYEEGDRKLNQSIAIARYIAATNNLLPSDPWTQAVLDAAVFNLLDFYHPTIRMYYIENDPAKKAEMKKNIMEEKVPHYFSRFEKELKANNGFFAGKLTWAEFMYTGLIETANLILGEQIEKNYPAVAAIIDAVRSSPKIKEYIKKRGPYTM